MKRAVRKKQLFWSWFFVVLSFAVMISGAVLCIFAAREIKGAIEAESAEILHEPVNYISGVRDVVNDMVNVIALGIFAMIFGSVVMSVAIARRNGLCYEGAKVAELEQRVAKLESSKA